jgi:hypothetical protein
MNTVLEPGEYQLGGYQVQFVDWNGGEWRGAGFWLRAIVTNRRLLVFPDTRRSLEQTRTIKPEDIARVWNLCLGRRDGVLVILKDGRRFYLLVDWSQGGKLARDLNELLAPPLKPRILPRPRPA